MRRPSALLLAALVLPLGLTAPSVASPDDSDDDTDGFAHYVLHGDPGGSKFEGIGVAPDEETFYVSEVTGGEIHRGDVDRSDVQVWKDEGADGRSTARGIDVDEDGRVYIAGGPNNIDDPTAPHLWVYDEDGTLSAALRISTANVYLNDVVIGPDGAAYFTNSNAPQIYRVAEADGTWTVSLWKDASGSITRQGAFNLNGLVVSPDRQALVVAQTEAGKLWRFDLDTRAVTPVDIGTADLTGADGLVLEDNTLMVVRNFAHQLALLELDDSATSAELLRQVPTPSSRVFTTGKIADDRLLLVDSKFDEEVASPPYHVVGEVEDRFFPEGSDDEGSDDEDEADDADEADD